ncbi:hypothetical protein Tco_0363220 [Tanacetum coccineum]
MTGSISNNMHDLLVKLLTQLGNMNINGSNSLASNVASRTSPTLVQHNTPIASQRGPTHGPTLLPPGFIPLQAQPTSYYINVGPPGFVPPLTQLLGFKYLGRSSHLNSSITSLSDVFNTFIYLSVSVGDGHSIPVINTGHSILPTPYGSLHLNNVLITPNIVKNLISVLQFVRDNNCTIEFDAFGFSVKDFITRRVLLRCDSTGDLYPVTPPSPIPHAFLVSQHTWHQRLGHPGLGKHAWLPFVSSNTVINSCFEIIHSDV